MHHCFLVAKLSQTFGLIKMTFRSILINFISIFITFRSIYINIRSIFVHFRSIFINFGLIFTVLSSIDFYFQTCGLWSRWLFDRFWSILDQFSSILDWFTSILDCFWLIIFYYFQTFGLWSRWWYQWRINFCFEIFQSRPISNLSQNWNSVFYQTSGRSWTRIWTLD